VSQPPRKEIIVFKEGLGGTTQLQPQNGDGSQPIPPKPIRD
jgi:hypothetical protein